MGWWWNSSAENVSKDTLDPSLRDWIDAETQSGQRPALPQTQRQQAAAESSQSAQYTSAFNFSSQQQTNDAPEQPIVPPQSAFPDGRYAHLWKNYVPQDQLNNQAKTEQDKLKDIVDAYNDRRSEIGRVAMENCALEYLDQFNCFKAPGFWQMATMCRAETRKFNRCYEMQSKFLKALGFLSLPPGNNGWDRERDEEMQMHADKLYQRMLEIEAEQERAKEEGREVSEAPSLLTKENIAQALRVRPQAPGMSSAASAGASPRDDEEDIWSRVKPEARAEYEKKIAELPAAEQEIERQALLGELRSQQDVAKKVEVTFVEERINRMKRREAGQSTIGDMIKRVWGWD